MDPILDAERDAYSVTLTRPPDRARQRSIDRRMLYVLVLGIVGAIVADAAVLAYFLS
jgi:hypothetical protein